MTDLASVRPETLFAEDRKHFQSPMQQYQSSSQTYPHLSFALDPVFVDGYAAVRPQWGFPVGGGNTLGEITFLTKYSRRLENGAKERWFQCCERVINGMYSLLKDHCAANRTPWDEAKAQRSAQEAYRRMFAFKWLPSGRGLWVMGTQFVHEQRNGAALQSCAFLSTGSLDRDPTYPFIRLMEMSMLGVGVGFDTLGAGKVDVLRPSSQAVVHVVEDSREGWFLSVRDLLCAYLTPGTVRPLFNYSAVRPAGSPIKSFGGTAAGPEPLQRLHLALQTLLNKRIGSALTSTDIVDVMNLIGKCVVSGNVRRSAEIALGSASDNAFLELKNWEVNPERMGADGWGHLSNNSVITEVGEDLQPLVERIALNGEPGVLYLDLVRKYGRLVDPPQQRRLPSSGDQPMFRAVLGRRRVLHLGGVLPQQPREF